METNTQTNMTVFKVKNVKLNSFVKDSTTLTRTGVTFDRFDTARDALAAFVARTKLPWDEMRIVRYTVTEDLIIRVDRD